MGDDIDPVEFGKLIAAVDANTKMGEKLVDKLDLHIDATNTRFANLEAKDEKRKHFILGALGAGTLGGATFGEGLKHVLKSLWP